MLHCRLLTSSSNLRGASTSVRSQPCFNVIVRIPHIQVTLLAWCNVTCTDDFAEIVNQTINTLFLLWAFSFCWFQPALHLTCPKTSPWSSASASVSVLAGRDFDSRPGLTKTLEIGTAVFLPGARSMEELQEIHPEHKKKPGNCTNSIVALQDHCAVVKKRQQQTTTSKKTITCQREFAPVRSSVLCCSW